VVKNIANGPLAIASASMAFTMELEHNLKNKMQEIEEYKERIRTLEEVQFYKGDKTNIQEFRISIEGVRKELHIFSKEIYVAVQEF
jgi:hypothetical protein